MDKDKGILEELRRNVGCLYISDLHDSSQFEQVRKAVSEINPDQYEDKEWREAYEYVTGRLLPDMSGEQIRTLFEKIG